MTHYKFIWEKSAIEIFEFKYSKPQMSEEKLNGSCSYPGFLSFG
jgi:hypothetical protein